MTNNNNNNRRNNKSNPVSYNARLAPNVPLVQQRIYSGKDIIVTDFQGVASFGSSDYALNPRLSDKFPSASLTAQRYDMYQFDELVFRFHPTTAVTNTPGVMFMAWEPNANRGPPDTIAQINAFECHTEGPIYNPNLTLRIPKSRLGGPRYVRAGPTMSDLNLYDTGRLVVASDDVTGSEGGYVEVMYRIRFFNYHLEETTPVQNRVAEATRLAGSGDQTVTTATKTTVLFDSLLEDFNGDDTIALASGLITLPSGKYLILTHVSCNNSANEVTEFLLEIEKNGASLGTPAKAWSNLNLGAVNGKQNISTSAIVSSNGTDTFSAAVTLTGATGVLKVLAGYARFEIIALS